MSNLPHRITHFFFTLPLPVFVLLLFVLAGVAPLHSTTKLKKLHRTIGLRCKDCHHKPKKGSPKNIAPTPGNKKCYQCHIKGRRRVKHFNELQPRLKKFHMYCARCHERNGKHGIKSQLKKHLRNNSTCLFCHR